MKIVEVSMLFDFYGDILTEKQQDVIRLYYDEDLSLSEIAENSGITRQGVRDSLKRAETQLLEMEEKLGLVIRFYEMQKNFVKIEDAAMRIKEINKLSANSADVEKFADKIIDLSGELSSLQI